MSSTHINKSSLQRWGHALSDQQRKVLRDIGLCRTAALGTHLRTMRSLQLRRPSRTPHSSSNRHCPKCPVFSTRSLAPQAGWKSAAGAYAHVVFTVPGTTGRRSHCATVRLFYTLAVSGSFRDAAQDRCRSTPSRCAHPVQAGRAASPGRRTWRHHPHLHTCLVAPTGGLAFNCFLLDPNQTSRVLPPGARAQPHVPRQAAQLPQG